MPSSQPPLPDRLRRDALVRHGVGPAAVEAVVRAARSVHRLTREHGVEVAATVDAESGEEPAPIVRGTRRSVDVTSHLQVLVPDRAYVMLHSHPGSESVGWQDGGWLIRAPDGAGAPRRRPGRELVPAEPRAGRRLGDGARGPGRRRGRVRPALPAR
jgi:hypothetical protein